MSENPNLSNYCETCQDTYHLPQCANFLFHSTCDICKKPARTVFFHGGCCIISNKPIKEPMMSELLKRIRDDLKTAMIGEVQLRKSDITSGDVFDTAIAHKTVSRAIISMFPEIRKKPNDANDDDVIKLLKKYIGQEKERNIYQLGYLKEKDVEGKSPSEVKNLVNKTMQELGDKLTSTRIFIAQSYLPAQETEETVVAWINDNIDFSQYKNKMQAMSPIMKQFKGCDGNFVKGILLKM